MGLGPGTDSELGYVLVPMLADGSSATVGARNSLASHDRGAGSDARLPSETQILIIDLELVDFVSIVVRDTSGESC